MPGTGEQPDGRGPCPAPQGDAQANGTNIAYTISALSPSRAHPPAAPAQRAARQAGRPELMTTTVTLSRQDQPTMKAYGAGWSGCGPAVCPGASGLPQTRPCPHPAARRRIGTKAAGTLPRDAARVLRRQHDGHVAQKVAGHPAGRPATACKTALRPAVRQKIFGRHRRGFRNLELGPATQEPDRGCCIPVAGPAATGSGLPGSSAPGAAAVVCPGMAAGRGAPAQALNDGSGARPDGHRPHGPRPEDVLTAGRFPRQRGLAADRAEAVFTSP